MSLRKERIYWRARRQAEADGKAWPAFYRRDLSSKACPLTDDEVGAYEAAAEEALVAQGRINAI